MKKRISKIVTAALARSTGLALAVISANAEDVLINSAAIAQSGSIAPYDEGPAQAMEVATDELNAKRGLLGQ